MASPRVILLGAHKCKMNHNTSLIRSKAPVCIPAVSVEDKVLDRTSAALWQYFCTRLTLLRMHVDRCQGIQVASVIRLAKACADSFSPKRVREGVES